MGLMNIDFFKKCIDCLYEGGTKALTLASRGEPTLHPKFSEMINYCKNKFIEFKINTNATRLDDYKIRSILEAEVNELVFSVDAHTSELYEKIRPSINKKNNFNLVIENIKKFNLIRKQEYPHSKTKTRVSGVVFREDQNIEEITKFWKKYVDDVAFVRAQNRWDTYMNEKVPLKSHCNYLWERFYVWFDGTTNPCDVDYKSYLSGGKLDPDNVSVEEIKRIWNSKKLNDIRNNHDTGNRNKVNPCDRCGIE